jgi:competence protein ComEA
MQKIHIPSILFALCAGFSLAASAAESVPAQATMPAAQVESAATSAAVMSKINLNTADAATLERELLGIGQVKAQAIIEYRDANGAFASVDDLLEVKGIGAATLEKNRDRVSVN